MISVVNNFDVKIEANTLSIGMVETYLSSVEQNRTHRFKSKGLKHKVSTWTRVGFERFCPKNYIFARTPSTSAPHSTYVSVIRYPGVWYYVGKLHGLCRLGLPKTRLTDVESVYLSLRESSICCVLQRRSQSTRMGTACF